MKKYLPILSVSSLFLATLGFLFIQTFVDSIDDKERENLKLIRSMQVALEFMLKANEYIIHLDQSHDHIYILRNLNANKMIIEKIQNIRLERLRVAVTHSINSALASDMIDSKEAEKVVGSLDSLLKGEELDTIYQDYMKKADLGIKLLKKDIKNNRLSLINIESNKKVLWYKCFVFQSIGMILGILALVFKKKTKE